MEVEIEVMSRKTLSYYFASFFILCGLITGILGTYTCVTTKHYEGGVLARDSVVPVLEAGCPNDIIKQDYPSRLGDEPTVWYSFYTTERIEGLPYTTVSNLVWVVVVVGLAYLGLGIATLVKKDLLFNPEKKDDKGSYRR